MLLGQEKVIVGAERFEEYVPKLKSFNNKVALVCNQTSMVGHSRLLDTLLAQNVNITKVFSLEHGFKGVKGAGEHINNQYDEKTQLPIISLYGSKLKPTQSEIYDVDVIVFDIQDVGTRFYTYISSLQYLLESCVENSVEMIILDRPNPNGHYIDGPTLLPRHKSFVGMNQIPVVYGMTIGEYAHMIIHEGWLNQGNIPKYSIVKCLNYSHQQKYEVPIAPSPNLKTSKAIALYPSLCFFEGTNVSVGRGTDKPFMCFGSPYLDKNKFNFKFLPKADETNKTPMFLNEICYGEDLSNEEIYDGIQLDYLIKAYKNWKNTSLPFFEQKNLFFDKLAGTDKLRLQIEGGSSAYDIKKEWLYDLLKFNSIRKRYLFYEDFEFDEEVYMNRLHKSN
jgi:uncharacterized protein YbbC (DUF1343 family)